MIGRSRKREEILVSPKLMPLGVSSSQGRCWKSVYYIKVLQSYKKAIPTLTLCAKNHLYPIIFCVEPAGKFQFSSPCVSDRPTCLTFFCSKMSKNAQWINKEYCFFIRQTEVQPDFAIAMSVPTECRAMRAGSQKLCWGAAWLRECKDTTCTTRNPNFFGIWYRTPKFFYTFEWAFSPLSTGIPAHFPHAKKNEIGIWLFISYRLSKCTQQQLFCLPQMLQPHTLLLLILHNPRNSSFSDINLLWAIFQCKKWLRVNCKT